MSPRRDGNRRHNRRTRSQRRRDRTKAAARALEDMLDRLDARRHIDLWQPPTPPETP